MQDIVVCQMWGPFRQMLIAQHRFYVEQAHKRLLSQFDNMEAEADKAGEDWFEEAGKRFDPDRDDEGSFYERALDESIGFYTALNEMREQTRLTVVAGMFHVWDKRLKEWLVSEISHWHSGSHAVEKMWEADFPKMRELFTSLGWPFEGQPFLDTLNACRLVVNVYKHGDGKSLKDLKKNHDRYLRDPFHGTGGTFSKSEYRNYTHLAVSDEQIVEFSDAIVAFWNGIPENTLNSQTDKFPSWLDKAIRKDRES